MINFFKKEFANLLSKNIELDFNQILDLIEIPPENIPGDLAFPCFKISGILKKSPNQVSLELVEKMNDSNQYFSKFQALGPYLNVHFNQNAFVEKFFVDEKINHYKENINTRVMVEYMSANPNKPLHIGQARNICIWDSVARIFKYLWYDTHTFNYGDDSWVNVWYNIVWHLYYDFPLESDKKFDHYCGTVYTQMKKKDEDPQFKKLLSDTLLKIEDGKDENVSLLHDQYVKKCALEQLKSCWRMWASFDGVIRETDILHIKFFAEAIDLLREKWYVKYIDEWDAKWCRVIDLSSLPEYAKEEKQYQILIKSDGVATYVAKDIAFAMWKLGYLNRDFSYDTFAHDEEWNIIYTTHTWSETNREWHFGRYNQAITVIDNRQIPPQQIVRSSLKLLGYLSDEKKYEPLGYGVVYLTPKTLLDLWFHLTEEEKSEKRLPFASRKWRTVTMDEMLEMLHKKAYRETKERNPEKYDVRLDDVAEKIAVSSLRFFLTKTDISKDIVFDIEEVLDMQWETWAYVLYAWARMKAILDQSEMIVPVCDFSLLAEEIEFKIVKKISELEWIINFAKDNLQPHLICRFLLDLARLANEYYAKVKILSAPEDVKKARLYLIQNMVETLSKAMDLIGMKFLERM